MKKRMRVVKKMAMSVNCHVYCNERGRCTLEMTSKTVLRILILDDIDWKMKLDMKTKGDGFKINEECIDSSQQQGKRLEVAS